jgi:hypothetical protein
LPSGPLPRGARTGPPVPPADDEVEDGDDVEDVEELDDCCADPPHAAATRATKSRPAPVMRRRRALTGL